MPAMVLLIRWQFDNCKPGDLDSWWKDMRIETQLLCERALQYSGRGGSLLYFNYEEQAMYMIDIVLMIQRNLRTGRVRPLRRVEVQNFSFTGNCFYGYTLPEPACTSLREVQKDWREEHKWRRPLEPPREYRRDRDRRQG